MSGCDRGINHQSQHTHLGGNLIHRGSYVLELNLRFPDDAGLSLSRVAVILKYSDDSSLAGLRERRAVAAASPAFLDDTYGLGPDRKSTRLNSSHDQISYAVFCLKKK